MNMVGHEHAGVDERMKVMDVTYFLNGDIAGKRWETPSGMRYECDEIDAICILIMRQIPSVRSIVLHPSLTVPLSRLPSANFYDGWTRAKARLHIKH